jgi:uncharacterized SAM-binding protein YcdF (DUF218 family)
MMAERGFRSVLIATSWYHTRRSRLLAQAILAPAGIAATVVQVETDADLAHWWTRRYLAITVLEELGKLFIERWVGTLAFSDDPGRTDAEKAPSSLASGCNPAVWH